MVISRKLRNAAAEAGYELVEEPSEGMPEWCTAVLSKEGSDVQVRVSQLLSSLSYEDIVALLREQFDVSA